MKDIILKLLECMYYSDSKSESWKYEKELCKILNEAYKKLETIEDTVSWHVRDYPDSIVGVNQDCYYPGMTKLPKIIECTGEKGYLSDEYDFDFQTEWLDMDLKIYFEKLKLSGIRIKETTIKNVEASLNKHKQELEELKKLSYETLDSKR